MRRLHFCHIDLLALKAKECDLNNMFLNFKIHFKSANQKKVTFSAPVIVTILLYSADLCLTVCSVAVKSKNETCYQNKTSLVWAV